MDGPQVASYTSLSHNANNSAISGTSADDDNYGGYDSFDEQNYERPAERWAPLGAADVSPGTSQLELSRTSESDQLQQLEEEQEMLNNSLLSLTSHFAQVQFRLKQIVDAEPEDKETLLKDLEQFAFKGIPDMHGCGGLTNMRSCSSNMSHAEHETRICEQRDKQRELITQLKSQLEDLELYAYETGDAELPTSQVIEKQSVLIDQLRNRLDMNLEDFDKLSTDELKRVVDHAISRIVNPALVKENLVEQLKTQIVDLERFIQFLHGEAIPADEKKCTCPVHDSSKQSLSHRSRIKSPDKKHKVSDSHVHQQTMSTMKKVLALLQIFAISQLGCGGREFQRNLLKRTAKGNHWGDLRAKLTVAVDKVIMISKEQDEEREITLDSDCSSDSDEGEPAQCDPALTQAVRRDLASSLRDLMQHGLMEISQNSSLVSFGCFPSRSAKIKTKMIHAWDLLLKYYDMKHGREYNDSPARKLSQSFHLDIVGGKAVTAKQTLLGAIGTVISSHTPLKRSEDSHFKAFLCLALNEKKLVIWLRLLYRTQSVIDYYYQDWSYAAKTGFEDALKALERLNTVSFKLPVDLAVRQFSNIKDAF